MADSDDPQPGEDKVLDAINENLNQQDYVTERQMVAARFVALGGGTTIDMDLAKMPKLADLVTPQHRDMVKDLAAYLPHEMVARIMGISKERLQALFEHELEVGFHLAKASLGRAAYIKGVSGDVQAMALWLRNHNRSDWAQKLEKTEKGAAQDAAEVDGLKAAGQDLLAAVLTSMSTDKKLFKAPKSDKPKPVKVVKSDKPKPVKAGATLKKPKGD